VRVSDADIHQMTDLRGKKIGDGDSLLLGHLDLPFSGGTAAPCDFYACRRVEHQRTALSQGRRS